MDSPDGQITVVDDRFGSISDALLPNRTDVPLDEIANSSFIDDGVKVPVSPVDQFLMALTRRTLADPGLGGVAVVLLPRAQHQAGVLLGICAHLLCRQPPATLGGPVVYVGSDVALASQLRTLSVEHYRRMGLRSGNPLSAHRLTGSGRLESLAGGHPGYTDSSFVYYNTRVGQPNLSCTPPLVIVDATSIAKRDKRERALEWASRHRAAGIVVIGDIGDDQLLETVTATGAVPTVCTLTVHEVKALVDNFGPGRPVESSLSTMNFLCAGPQQIVLHRSDHPGVNEAVTTAIQCVATKPKGPLPPELEVPMKLLRNGTRLAARTRDYRVACANNVRPGESPIPRVLQERQFNVPGEWRSWGVARWGSLKNALRTLWELLDEENPKTTELWRALDQISRTNAEHVLIRCHSRASAEATKSTLATGDRTPEQVALWERVASRVEFCTFKDRYPVGAFDAQVLTGAPPPWQLPLLLGAEAQVCHVLVYEAEELVLRRQLERTLSSLDAWQAAACRTLHVAPPLLSQSPLAKMPDGGTGAQPLAAFSVPDLSLADALDQATQAIDPQDVEVVPAAVGLAAGSRSCVPVRLVDGRTWWCISDDQASTPVVVITAAGHENRPVKDLQAGDRIIVPAGDSTDSPHARLVAASRSNSDVKMLDLILSQFRSAGRAIRSSSRTQREAIEKVRASGASAPDQLPKWASGATIAPQEPGDVAAVFKAAGRPCPDLALVYAVANKLRSLNRILGRFAAALSHGHDEQTLAKLRELVGPTADEIVDEFQVREVAGLGEPTTVSASLAGRIR